MAASASTARRITARAKKPINYRVTMTKEEKARAHAIAPAISLKDVIRGGVLATAASKERKRRRGNDDLTTYDMGLSEDDLQRWKESFE